MFEFPRFATDDPRHAVELVRAHPFALVVSATDGVPIATHVPVIEERRRGRLRKEVRTNRNVPLAELTERVDPA